MAPSVKEINAGVNAAGTVLQTAKVLNKTIGRQSIARMASDSILQFPTIMSSDIPTDKAIIIAKAFERNYAALMIAIFSRDPAFSFKKYVNATEYIKSKHNNSNIPSNILAATNLLTNESSIESVDGEITVESATIDPELNKILPKEVVFECWNDTEDQYDMQSINDIYKPFKKTTRTIKSAVESMTKALEADKQDSSKKEEASTPPQGPPTRMEYVNYKIKDSIGPDFRNKISDDKFKGANSPDIVRSMLPGAGFVDKNTKLSLLEPTMISVNLIGYGGDVGGQVAYNVILGIKTMIRSVKSDAMVSNVVEMCKGSNLAFKFIQFTQNAKDFVKEFFFHTKQIKDDAINKQNFQNFAGSLKKRKKIDNITKFLSNRLLPNTTLVITAYEAMRIKQECGCDLYNRAQALKMMDKYYLLGFAIVDTETEIVSVLFDGDNDFSETTLSAMNTNTNRASNAADIKEILKTVGKL